VNTLGIPVEEAMRTVAQRLLSRAEPDQDGQFQQK
jgi:hypothetical protein